MEENKLFYYEKAFDITKIDIPEKARTLSHSLDALRDSMAQVGLLHPLHVKMVGKRVELLSGYKRLTVAKELGWTTIPVLVSFYGEQAEQTQEMAIIDENICREALTCLEFAEALGRAKEIYETRYPETKHGGRKKKAQDPENGSSRPAFVDDMASKLGQSRSSLSDYLYVYKHTTQEVRDLIRNNFVANFFKDLHALAKERTHQMELAHFLHEHPLCMLWEARRLFDAQTRRLKDEGETATITEPGEPGEVIIPPQYEDDAAQGYMDSWYAEPIPHTYRRVEEGHTLKIKKNDVIIVLKRSRPDYFRIYETQPAIDPQNKVEERRALYISFTRERYEPYDG
jgi:hypothetical protein